MNAITCAVVNHKGGVGKTTLAMNLAAGLTRRGSCIVLDADPQCSASRWARLAADARPFPAPVLPAADGAARQLVDCAGRYAYIVVDCPPAMHSQDVQQVLTRADVALIPVLPSPMDLGASVGMEEIVVSAQQSNTALRAYSSVEPAGAAQRAVAFQGERTGGVRGPGGAQRDAPPGRLPARGV